MNSPTKPQELKAITPPKKSKGRIVLPSWFFTTIHYAFMLALTVLFVGPFFWLFSLAFRGSGGIYDLTLIPDDPTLENFVEVWKAFGFARAFLNSVVVAVTVVAFNVLTCSMAAYPLARMKFRGRSVIFVLILSTLMIPEQVTVVPLFRSIVAMGLYDTLIAVVLPFSVSAFGIFLCRQSFMSIPKALEEAATIDGAGPLKVWWHVMLPLARPALATLAVFSVIGAWSNLLWPLIVLQDQENFTLPVAINQLLGVFATNIRYAYAGSVLAIIPVLVFYLAAQRWLIRGLLAGAVKG